ncbi:MAG: TonB-dependent receptor [Bacteroidales bacterium]|nr:TonB-dependent receptor [Bacteroidales bacterium]
MKKTFLLALAILCILPASAQTPERRRSMVDSVFSLDSAAIYDYYYRPLQENNIKLINIDVPLKYLPVTVSRIEAKTLERNHILSLEDAVKYLPGVVQTSDQLGAFKRYSIRGTTDAVIAWDGIRDERSLLNNVPFSDLSSVESIEVLKGPSSVLSGHSVMGGVINIIRKKATPQQTVNASISLGSWNQKEATVGFGGKLIGPVNYRAHVHYANGDGYRGVNANNFSGMFTLGSAITENGYLEAIASFNDDRYTTDIGGAPVMPGDVYSVAGDRLFASNGERNPFFDYDKCLNDNANNHMQRRVIDLTLAYTHKLTDFMTLRERFNYSHSDLDYWCVENVRYLTSTSPIYDYWYLNNRGVKTYVDMENVQSGTPLCFNPDSYNYTNVLELGGKFNTGNIRHNYNLGWNYQFFDYTQYNGYGKDDVWGPGLGEIVSLKDPHTVRDWWDCKVSAASIRNWITNGIYAHDVVEFSEQFKAMLGLRYDFYHYQNASATISDGLQHYDEANRTDWKELRTSALTYKLGLVYLPVKNLSLYGSVANYFKPNSTVYNPNYIYVDRNGKEFNPDEAGGEVFKPEKGWQGEIGARLEIADWFDINASVFYIRKYNVVRTIGNKPVEENGSVVNKSVRAQVGRQTSKGVDFDMTFRPAQGLQLTSGLAVSDMRTVASYLDWIPKDADWVTYNEDGTINLRATNFPRTTFYAYADYTIQKGFFKNLSFHLNGNYTDKRFTNVANNVYLPATFIVDGGLYYTLANGITLAGNLYNIFNTKYFISATRPAKPRHFMVTVGYRF